MELNFLGLTGGINRFIRHTTIQAEEAVHVRGYPRACARGCQAPDLATERSEVPGGLALLDPHTFG